MDRVFSILSYLILVLSYSIILKEKNITIVYPILKVLSVFIVVFAGLVFFNNQYDSITIIGILFGMVSIYLLSSKMGVHK